MSNGNGVRIHEGLPHPLGATWDGLGVNFALFSAQRHQGRALPVRRRRATRKIERIELPEYTDEIWHGYLPGRRARAASTAIACTVPTSRRRAIASIRTSCCSTRTRKRMSARSSGTPRVFGYTIGADGDDLTFDERDSAPFVPKCRVVDPAFTWDAASKRPRCRGTAPSSTRRTCAASPSGIRRVPETHARHLRRPGAPAGHRATSSASASPRSSCCRSTPSSTTATCSNAGCSNYWGYNTHRLLRARPALRRPTRPTACASSRRWWRACTTPASR